jgi:hypothetical protein
VLAMPPATYPTQGFLAPLLIFGGSGDFQPSGFLAPLLIRASR